MFKVDLGLFIFIEFIYPEIILDHQKKMIQDHLFL